MTTAPDNTSSASSIKKAALVVATTVSFVSPFMGAATNIALPTIGKDLGLDAVTLSWVATSFLLASAIFLVPFGRLADIFGRKRIFLYGISIFTVVSIGCAISTSAGMLIFFRVAQGFGSSMIVGTSVSILTSVYPPGERGKALGVNVAAVYMGLSLGPFLGGFLTQQLGWQSIFLMNVVLGLVIIAVTLAKLKGEWAGAKGEAMDVKGSIIYCLALVALMYGLSVLPEKTGFALIAVGLVGLGAFVLLEQRLKSPVLDIGLFKRNSIFALSNLAAFIHYGATFGITFLLSLYLQYLKGFTPQQAGFILVCQPLLMAAISPFAGRISDKTEPRIVASVGMALTTVGLFMLTFLGQDTSLAFIIAALVVLGVGFALFSSPNTNAIMCAVEKRNLGVASAITATMRSTGMMVSMGIAMFLFSVFIGRVRISPENYPLFLKSARTAFIIFTVLCFCGIFASLARGNIKKT